MQTFLPYPDAVRSARVLDSKRLGKQIMEAGQILRALTLPPGDYGWQNHPATTMWTGCEGFLYLYANACAGEWKRLPNTKKPEHGAWTRLRREFSSKSNNHELLLSTQTPPRWWGDPQFHLSHQSNLVRKNPDHYRKFFPDVPDDLPYVWPEP